MPKLFVITARDVDSAIILRRGPSEWFHLITWDTHRDHFEHGAWIKGRIYCEKCDLSPNGQLFLYTVRHAGSARTKLTDVYSAISRPPWLFALAVQPHGTSYGGGGQFLSETELNTSSFYSYDAETDQLKDTIRCFAFSPPEQAVGFNSGSRVHTVEVPDADWSGRDRKGRVIFTRGGCVYRMVKTKAKHKAKLEDELVADFSELKPDPQPSPRWARIPLRSGSKH